MTYHFASDEGFLAHPDAPGAIERAHLGRFIPKIDWDEAQRLREAGAVFVDARRADDFKAGHLDGAINISTSAGADERRKAMEHVAEDARVVVYCHSAGCTYAERVAVRLKTDGFIDVSILKEGWVERPTSEHG
jgi:rhodanese-related sulfurtransferase